MPNSYVLIDYENVQPKNLDLLENHPFKVLVFVGQSQARIPFDLADSMQLLGKDARYVRISGNGQNALDFHIAYYIGELAASEPDAFFHIISKDKGFDPLINHLKDRKIRVHREKDIGEIPVLQLADTSSIDEKISAIVKNLGGRGLARPRKVTTLSNTINSLFNPKLGAKELTALVKEMEKRKLIVINQNNVSYKLPH
jgi:hypothetical protein